MDTTNKVLIWDRLSIGNPDIDNDHKKLLEIYIDLFDLIEQKKSLEEFAKILSKMTDYSLIHFKREESYMESLAYPNIKEHKDFHKYYIYKVAKYNFDLFRNNPPDPEEILKFIKEWWVNHILKIDSQIENYKKENALNFDY